MKKLLSWPLLLYLRFFARRALYKHRPTIIGIAGAIGKSSAVQALYAILKEKYRVRYTPGNSETGVPLGILGIPHGNYSLVNWIQIAFKCLFIKNPLKDLDYLIVEMGTDELKAPKNMEYLLTIVKPDIAIWLNVYAAHTGLFAEGLSDKEKNLPLDQRERVIIQKIAAEDGKIITKSGCNVGIYCGDNVPIVEELRQKTYSLSTTKLVSFGEALTNEISYGEYTVTLSGTFFEFVINKEQIKIIFKNILIPLEYRENFAAVLLAAQECGVSPHEAAQSLVKNFILPPGRSSMFEGIKDSVIIDSSYNSSPAAVTSFLELVKGLGQRTGRPVVCLFGDMRELGETEAIEHQRIAERLTMTVDYLYCVGSATRLHIIPYIDYHVSQKILELRWFKNSQVLGEYVREHMPEKALILVKGSQNTIYLEEAIKYLLKNKADESKLCRQSEYWEMVKKKFFEN
jgi:UDP-N-acetylmuramoyl-tripeptide--D-alanyl-D-alanine ligase